jgi:hypothetical protein
MAEQKWAKQKDKNNLNGSSQSPIIFFFFNLTATTKHHRHQKI